MVKFVERADNRGLDSDVVFLYFISDHDAYIFLLPISCYIVMIRIELELERKKRVNNFCSQVKIER